MRHPFGKGASMKPVWAITTAIALLIAIGVVSSTIRAQQDDTAVARQKRDQLRAFYTAPPVIPHEAYANDPAECAYCHSDVRETPHGTTLITPHIEFHSCAQCHVRAASELGSPTIQSANRFQGLETPNDGHRWSEISPPTVPHRTALREGCLTCHAANSPYEHLRCPHPERSQCYQCHVAGGSEFEVTFAAR